MGVDRHRHQKLVLIFLAGIFLIYSLVVILFSGDIGFDGDDWWVLGWAYWHHFPQSIIGYASEFLRPVEGVYWISMFQLFGFNSLAFHLCSFLLMVGACILMGRCLQNAFPNRSDFVVLAVIFAFFLPTVSSLTYLVFTDNSRLSMLIFWGCVVAFQFWARTPLSISRLIPPISLYLLSFLTYEASSFLIFVIPLLVWPVHKRVQNCSDKKFLFIVGTALVVSFGAALIIRFLFLNGGVVVNKTLIPSWELFWTYFALLPFYMIAPFTYFPINYWVWIISLVAIICFGAAIFYSLSMPGMRSSAATNLDVSAYQRAYILALGLMILLLGVAPYQIAGYGSETPKIVDTVVAKWSGLSNVKTDWFNFNEASRIYSSGSFGIAIILSALATTWKSARIRCVGVITAMIVIGMMILFHVGLSLDWQEAAEIRRNIIQSLVAQVPNVTPKTNFVFLDLESYHKRAAVIRGWAGLRELVRLLYSEKSLGAWYVYDNTEENPNTCEQQAIVLPNGFASRGLSLDKPAPHSSLLVMKRSGDSLIMLNNITPSDLLKDAEISWRQYGKLSSNPNRILTWHAIACDKTRLSRNQWTSGLIKTLGLVRPGVTAGLLRGHRFDSHQAE